MHSRILGTMELPLTDLFLPAVLNLYSSGIEGQIPTQFGNLLALGEPSFRIALPLIHTCTLLIVELSSFLFL